MWFQGGVGEKMEFHQYPDGLAMRWEEGVFWFEEAWQEGRGEAEPVIQLEFGERAGGERKEAGGVALRQAWKAFGAGLRWLGSLLCAGQPPVASKLGLGPQSSL